MQCIQYILICYILYSRAVCIRRILCCALSRHACTHKQACMLSAYMNVFHKPPAAGRCSQSSWRNDRRVSGCRACRQQERHHGVHHKPMHQRTTMCIASVELAYIIYWQTQCIFLAFLYNDIKVSCANISKGANDARDTHRERSVR
jgi:hypothetical protein